MNLFRSSTDDLRIVNKLPYSDLAQENLEKRLQSGDTLEWGHMLEDQIGGQTDAGFRIIGFYEDTQPGDPLTEFVPNHIATLAEKP